MYERREPPNERNTYSVNLTFKEWMTVTAALHKREAEYREIDMVGRANNFAAISDTIASELANNDS